MKIRHLLIAMCVAAVVAFSAGIAMSQGRSKEAAEMFQELDPK